MLDYHLDPSLPRLAWCAQVRRAEARIQVRHGPWVETQADCFFEGAWDGPYEAARFDLAETLAGSGGRLTATGMVFAGPSHTLERLYTARVDDTMYVSNSLPFVLAEANLDLDLSHPDYFFDFLHYYRLGIHTTDKSIPTAQPQRVYLHDCCNLLVASDLTLTRLEKPLSPPPKTFADYVGFLSGTVNRVCRNAQHPQRRHVYRPLAMLSQGYDTTAVATLASRAGCREAITFRKSGSERGYIDDSGATIGRYLGLSVTEYDREDFWQKRGLVEAEFYLNPYPVTDRGMVILADRLGGALLLTGRHGENFWSTDSRRALPLLQEPTAILMSGAIPAEFRLRVGYIHFAVPYAGALHAPQLYRITCSPEMRPWSIGGDYDRPIPRRIAEEAGVPREIFGQVKKGGAWFGPAPSLLPDSERDFRAFYRTQVQPLLRPQPWRQLGMDSRYVMGGGLRHVYHKLRHRSPYLEQKMEGWFGDALHSMWSARRRYTFHWGVAHMRQRYQRTEEVLLGAKSL